MYVRKAQGWLKHIDFIVLDIILLFVSNNIAYFIRFNSISNLDKERYLVLLIMAVLFDVVYIITANAYQSVLSRGYWKEIKKTITQIIVLFSYISIFMFLSKSSYEYSRLFIIYWLLIYALILYVCVIIWKKHIKNKLLINQSRRILIITTSENAAETIKDMLNSLDRYTLIGVVVDDDNFLGSSVCGVPVIADYSSVGEYVRTNWVDEVLVNVEISNNRLKTVLQDIEDMGTTIHFVVGWSGSHNVFSSKIGPYNCVTRAMNSMTPIQAIVKRTIDIIGGLAGCFLTGIIYLIIAPIIKKESPGPVIYKSTRIGINGKPFIMYKFRSMYLDADERKKELLEQNRIKSNLMFKLDFDPRIIGNYIDEGGVQHTGIGEKIRRTSLDEFPQFFNVLKGDMSIVGTRPPTPDETENYEKHHKARLSIKPGVTGLWQISGRSDIVDFEEVVALDREYINNYSIGLDLKIILKTVLVVLKKEGAK